MKQSLTGLAALRDQLPAKPAAQAEPAEATPTVATQRDHNVYARAAKLVLRRERKGHGGKTATRIEGLAGSDIEMDTVLREVKRALGCGATIEGSDILVQGNQIDRLTAHLESRGAKKIIVGN